MKRMIISVTILLSMILMSIYFNYTVVKSCDEMIEIVEMTKKHIKNEDNESALKSIMEFKIAWDRLYAKGLLMLNGEKLNEIENCYTRIIPLIETDNDELLPELEELKGIFVYMRKTEIPSLKNIF